MASLSSYITAARKKDLSDRTIKNNLLDAGWTLEEVEAAFADDLPVPVPEGRKSPTGTRTTAKTTGGTGTMWDAFEHILLFISMYVLAFTIGATLILFIDRWVPGVPDVYNYGTDGYRLSTLRGFLAALIVSYPLFSFFFLRITKRTFDHPDIRGLKARKFLIYLTLVVAFLIVIGNVISVVYNFLNGNVTPNFFLKFVVIVSISSLIFGYYLQQVKEDRTVYA